MKIQARIAWVAVAVTLPQLAGLYLWDASSRHHAASAVLSSLATRAVGAEGAREACLRDPQGWATGAEPRPGRPGEPPSEPGRARVMPPELRVHAGAVDVRGTTHPIDALPLGTAVPVGRSLLDPYVDVALRTGWGGACEVVTVHGTTVPGFLGSVLPASPLWVAPVLLVATVLWLAVAPPVRRIRRLTEAVQADVPVVLEGDDEVAELSRAFERAARALREEVAAREVREQALRDFVAHTAHDVRIPLTVLQGHLVALEGNADGERLQAALREAHHLGALLGDLAAHARMDAPQPFGPVDLGSLVERVVARHLPLARRRGIALHHGIPDAPLVVEGDVTLAEQAVGNLVYNAIQHHHDGGHVAITLDRDGNGDGFTLVVLDDGPGVPPDALHHLTERGYRGDAARNRDARGSGLGLAIVARVADAHDWAFTLANRDEGGLVATLAGPSEGADDPGPARRPLQDAARDSGPGAR